MIYRLVKTLLLAMFAMLAWSQISIAATVIEDEGVTMSLEELKRLMDRWPEEVLRAGANDDGDRFELLNQAMSNKKIAMETDKLSPETDPEAYWKYYFMIQQAKQKYVFERFMEELEVPDMAPLAEETYHTRRDRFALVEEKRQSSHILFSCPPGCPRDQVRPAAEEVLLKLNQGEKFEDMVAQYSQDEGTKPKGGRMTVWMGRGEPQIAPPFLEGLFEIKEIGGYSTVVETQFGFHIIRLDNIQEAYYRPFDEVKAEIVSALEAEFEELSSKEFKTRYRLTDNVRIDGEAMEEIFAPYKTRDAQ